MTEFDDIDKILKMVDSGQHERHISEIKKKYLNVDSIQEVVKKAIENLQAGKNSFIIYGEPQSGKTEMMISLTAKLLDEGYKTIIILITDQIPLLSQNLLRFKMAKLNPSPRNYKEVLKDEIKIGERPFIIFCKKNANNLRKLIEKLGNNEGNIIIDDEADYATPNSLINCQEISKINELTRKILSGGGIYIGVTATPARLDLNNTHKNKTAAWIYFKPHLNYTGQDHFFPIDLSTISYKLNLLPDNYDSSYLKKALFRFLINVAHLNLTNFEQGYSMLIHTSRKKADHSEDERQISNFMTLLSKKELKESKDLYLELLEEAKVLFPGKEYLLIRYISENINRHEIRVLNSNRDRNFDSVATNPTDPFTIIIGGDIISRGVTFDRLLSMFFTRDVKTNFNQDTYIQRARMFGSRKDYIKYFELSIPRVLFDNWHTSFILHRLALKSVQSGRGPPIWPEKGKIKVTGHGSVDRETVIMNGSEMASGLFNYDEKIINIVRDKRDNLEKLKSLSTILGEKFPEFLIDFIENYCAADDKEIVLGSSSVMNWGDDTDKEEIFRPKGFLRGENFHQFRIFFNEQNKARIFYRPSSKNLGFLINARQINH